MNEHWEYITYTNKCVTNYAHCPAPLSVQVCEGGRARQISLLLINVYQQSASQGLCSIELATCI
jgi:hypothetical protein